MNYSDLEDWSNNAAQALQEFCDDAQVAAGNPDGEDQLRDIRELLKEHTAIVTGEGFLIHQLSASGEKFVIAALADVDAVHKFRGKVAKIIWLVIKDAECSNQIAYEKADEIIKLCVEKLRT